MFLGNFKRAGAFRSRKECVCEVEDADFGCDSTSGSLPFWVESLASRISCSSSSDGGEYIESSRAYGDTAGDAR